MTPDELKSLPKGHFVDMKTGVHPMRVKLKLFFKWGIQFDADNPYAIEDHGNRVVQYASRKELLKAILKKHRPDEYFRYFPEESSETGGVGMVESESNKPHSSDPVSSYKSDKKIGGGGQVEDRRFKPYRESDSDIVTQEVDSNEQT